MASIATATYRAHDYVTLTESKQLYFAAIHYSQNYKAYNHK